MARSRRRTGVRATSSTSAAWWKRDWRRRRPRCRLPATGWAHCTPGCGSAWPDGAETGLDAVLSAPALASFATLSVPGAGQRETELSLPYRGERLRGDALARQLETWVSGGVIEPSCAEAVREVAAHPEWLRLPGRTVIALGAGAEVGPLEVLLRWGARVAAVDLPSPPVWERVLRMARQGAGELLVPVNREVPAPPHPDTGDEVIARSGGPQPGPRGPGRRGLAGRPGRPARARQLRLRRRRRERGRVRRGGRAHRAPAGGPRRRGAGVSRHADRRLRRPVGRGRLLRPRLRGPVAQPRSWPAGRCAPRPAGGCSAAPTCPAPTPASATPWSPSKARTMPWRNGCSGGGPPSRARPGPPCRSTSPRPPGPGR